jgi:hypothetical protein
MAWKRCICKDHSDNVAIVTTVFMGDPEPWQVEFVKENHGLLACFDCGGEVADYDGAPDHVTATITTMRLRDLGVI